ncbi:MAG TPA: VanZ family protein [Methylococcales bacterium]|nr:VanZ family protein [Methylococcales bacterium]
MKKSSCKRYVFFLISLSITTIVYHKFVHDDLLHPIQNNLLKHFSESHEYGLNSLSKFTSLKELSLKTNGGKHKVFYSKFNVGEGNLFVLDYDIQVQNLKGVTKEKWHGFRFALYPEVKGVPFRSGPHVLFHVQQDGRYRGVSRVVFEKEYPSYFFAIELFADEGSMSIKNIKLINYSKGRDQLFFEYGLVCIWCIGILYPILFFITDKKNKFWSNISVGLLVIILVGVMVPNSSFHIIDEITRNLVHKEVSTKKHTEDFGKENFFKKNLLSITKDLDLPSVGIIKKGGHIVLFGLLTWSLFHALSQLKPFAIILSVSILAVTTEISQLNILSRTASLGDVGIDLIGVFLAYTLWVLIRVGGEEVSD